LLQYAFCGSDAAGGERLRVTGGRLRGRRLRVPRGRATRPTADRVRESLFARLGDLAGAAVLDLYAGTGALGIEALSRGASRAVFVDRGRAALASLGANLDELGLTAVGRVLGDDAESAVARLARAGERFEVIFVDPPYAAEQASRVLASVAARELLAPEGTLVLETSWRHPPGDPRGLVRVDERRYGETLVIWYAREEAAPGEEER
jgi:16S rRNA (guanine966-N2)-methyltransferase